MNSTNLLPEDFDRAVAILRNSERGRDAMQRLLDMLDAGGIGLDGNAKQAVITLLYGAFTDWPGAARDAMRQPSAKTSHPISKFRNTTD